MSVILPLAPSTARRCGAYATSLEPSSLVDTFMQYPPHGFGAHWLESGQFALPAFDCQFDLTMTLDDTDSSVVRWLRNSELTRRLLRFRTTFLGTTVSEYAPVPSMDRFQTLVRSAIDSKRDSQLVIIKDLPCQSPLLPAHANEDSRRLLEEASAAGYIIVEGQALAYVTIDFADEDEYLSRLSYRRRKDMRKKLRVRDEIEVITLQTGAAEFFNPLFIDELYQLYLNVFEQSRYQFDKLQKEFFRDVLTRRDSGGIVFLYRNRGTLIGFNLCFLHNNNLIDKYIGLRYPEARKLNLYFVSWFTNLEFARAHRLHHYVAGWTDPEVKKALGAQFTFTKHAVYIRNPITRALLKPFRKWFEPDANWAQAVES